MVGLDMRRLRGGETLAIGGQRGGLRMAQHLGNSRGFLHHMRAMGTDLFADPLPMPLEKSSQPLFLKEGVPGGGVAFDVLQPAEVGGKDGRRMVEGPRPDDVEDFPLIGLPARLDIGGPVALGQAIVLLRGVAIGRPVRPGLMKPLQEGGAGRPGEEP